MKLVDRILVAFGGIALVGLVIGAVQSPTIEHHAPFTVNGKTNIWSDSGSAPTWNGSALGGGGDTIWTNNPVATFQSATNILFIPTGITVGENTESIWGSYSGQYGESLVSIHDASHGDVDRFEIFLSSTLDGTFANDASVDLYGTSDSANIAVFQGISNVNAGWLIRGSHAETRINSQDASGSAIQIVPTSDTAFTLGPNHVNSGGPIGVIHNDYTNIFTFENDGSITTLGNTNRVGFGPVTNGSPNIRVDGTWYGLGSPSNWSASGTTNSTLSGNAILNAVTTTNLNQMGSGDEVHLFNSTTPLLLRLSKGTSASPDTNLVPMMKIERTANFDNTGISGDGAEFTTAFQSISKGTTQNGLQVVGMYGAATSSSTNQTTSGADDACAIYGASIITGSGTGTAIGGFLSSRKDTTTGKVNALELSVRNQTSTADAYSSTGFQDSQGIWIHGTGLTNVSAGIVFGNPFGPQFDVGIGFTSGVAGGQTGAVKTASIRDDGNAISSLVLNGHHTTGIDLSGATISGNAINLAATQIINSGVANPATLKIGGSAGSFADILGSDGTTLTFRNAPNFVSLFDEMFSTSTSPLGMTTVAANGGASANTTGTAAHPGVLQLQTGTSTNGVEGYRNSTAPMRFGGGRTIFQCNVRVPTLSDATELFVVSLGFGDNFSAAGLPTDGAIFTYSSSSAQYTNTTKWSGMTLNNTASTEVPSSITVTAGQFYQLRIDANAAGTQIDFYVDGVLIGSSSTNIPTSAGREFGLGYKIEKLAGTTGTTSRNFDLDYTWWTFLPTNSR